MGQQLLPPGFRFSPTDDELVSYYLRSKALGRNFHQAAITDVDVYKFEPWDLPGKSALPSKDQEWYFFSAQDKKYSHTARINRTTKKGYWKATGKDRKVFGGSSVVGLKKTLIYYEGRAPNGRRTNWIMHEYRLDEEFEKKENIVSVVVLCRIRKKGGPGPRNGEQYGAPIMTENVDLEEEANTGRTDDDVKIGQCVIESKGGGNVFNLRDQVEAWKQMGSSNLALDHVVIKEEKETGFSKVASDGDDLEDVGNGKGMIECDADLFAYFPSISDTAYSDMAPSSYKHGGDTFPCYHECLDMQNPGLLSEFDALPFLPTFWDFTVQDFTVPAVDESEIIREMSDRINDSKAVVGGTGSMMQPAASNVPLDGDYIGLEDLEAPFDGFTSRPSIHSSGRGKFERQQLWFRPDTNVETYGELQDSLHSKGPAAHGAGLPIPASKGGPRAANNVLSQEEKCVYGGNMSIPISRENFRNAGKNYPGSTSGAGDPRHVMESSTTSYLSKHVSTYAVSKHEMLPAQLCYASVTDGQDCVVTVKSSTASSTDFAVQGKCNVDADAFGKLPTTLIDLPSSSSLLIKNSKNIDTDALKRTPATPIYSSLSPSPPMKSTSSEGRRTNVKVPSASQTHDPRSEHANMSSSSRHRWKTPFRGLVSKAKQSALGTKLIELENGMWAKFNDKLSVLGKPAARFFPTRGSASLYDSLMQGLVATLFRLVAAVLSFLCLFWGFRVLVNYAFSVSV